MKKINPNYNKGWQRQKGMTLMELLIAGTISLIAASGMVIVMANTLGTGSQTIQAARLTQEMRTAMQIMSRELRRANYHSSYMACYGNTNCLKEIPDPGDPSLKLDFSTQIGTINIIDIGSNPTNRDCFYFWYDRPQPPTETQLLVTSEPVAAFRRTTVVLAEETVGKLQMIANNTEDFVDSDCNLNSNWTDITDPEIIDVTGFDVVDAGFLETINSDGDTQQIERIGLTIWAELRNAPLFLTTSTLTDETISRVMQEFITVRNHTTAAAPPPTT